MASEKKKITVVTFQGKEIDTKRKQEHIWSPSKKRIIATFNRGIFTTGDKETIEELKSRGFKVLRSEEADAPEEKKEGAV